MAITRIQEANGHNLSGSSNTTSTSAFTNPTTSGNAILVGAIVDGGTYTSVTDTQNNKYRLITRARGRADAFPCVEIWLAENIVGGASNVVTGNQNFADGVILAEEWSGLAALGSYDTSVGTGGGVSASPISTGASTSTRAVNELVFVVGELDISGTSNLSLGAGYSNFSTDRSNVVVGGIESKVVAAQGSQTATMVEDNSAGYAIALATFADTSLRPSFQPHVIRPRPFAPGVAR